jgi:hypothetical protein
VRWILKRIAKSFDPTKCSGVRHEVRVGKYDQWTKSLIGTIKGRDRRSVDEYGDVVVRPSRYRVDWRFVSTFLSVVEFCLQKSPNEDGSLPQVRAEDIWARCYEGGQANVPFCEKRWAICRDWLERQGIIKIVDRNWQRGKAMRWTVGNPRRAPPPSALLGATATGGPHPREPCALGRSRLTRTTGSARPCGRAPPECV